VATQGQRKPTRLLVHGAWCCADLEVELAQLSWSTETFDLPSALSTPALSEPVPGMRDDASVIHRAIDDVGDPGLVVGHSYGGIPATEAVGDDARNVVVVVYLAAFILDVGECLFTVTEHNVARDLPMMDSPRIRFSSGLLEEQARGAVSQPVRQGVRSLGGGLTRSGWCTTTATYIICTNDKTPPSDLQVTLAVLASAAARMDSGHPPFFSMPVELGRLVNEVALAAVTTKVASTKN
jgi:pimeloyl-ACP methyl ester carboxylesterase